MRSDTGPSRAACCVDCLVSLDGRTVVGAGDGAGERLRCRECDLRSALARALAERDDARAFARQAVIEGTLLEERIEPLEAHNAALREALVWYSELDSYDLDAMPTSAITNRARGALDTPPPVSPYRERVRREALEEAAKVCDEMMREAERERQRCIYEGDGVGAKVEAGRSFTAVTTANRIRSLATQDPETPT